MNKLDFISFIKSIYHDEDRVLLHRPYFTHSAKTYINECIDSNFVSSVGQRVIDFENYVKAFTGSKYAIATVNGTSALHIALKLVGVEQDTEVITQAVSFIATSNAIRYCNADPVFVDVSKERLSLNPDIMFDFLKKNAINRNGTTYNSLTGKRISACVPMHTFGLPGEMDKIINICNDWKIPVVEDSAESLGSYYKKSHTGTMGDIGVFSFNGNKIITTGGGGMIVTDDENIAKKAKYITTTAKKPHLYNYNHDMLGYNYRLPNLNAALGCEQMTNLERFIEIKRKVADMYHDYGNKYGLNIIYENKDSKSNYWLNAIVLNSREERDKFLEVTNENGVMTRPIWGLLYKQEEFKKSVCTSMENSEWLEDRIVNLPSSVPNYMMNEV